MIEQLAVQPTGGWRYSLVIVRMCADLVQECGNSITVIREARIGKVKMELAKKGMAFGRIERGII